MGLTPVMLWPACLLAVRNQPVRPEANLPFAGLRRLRRAFPQIAPANLWAPSAWGYAETIVLFAAVIIGGAVSHRGAVLGAFRPQGVLPERRRKIGAGALPKPIEIPNEDVMTLAGGQGAQIIPDAAELTT